MAIEIKTAEEIKPVETPATPVATPIVPTPALAVTINPPKQTPGFKFNKTALQGKLNDLIAFYKSFAGKPNHNPFFYLHQKIAPLQQQLNDGVETEELSDSINALEKKAPTVDHMKLNTSLPSNIRK